MSALRLTSALVIAMLMTTLLFGLMQALISHDPTPPPRTEELPGVGFLSTPPEPRPEPVREREPPPERKATVAPESIAVREAPSNPFFDGPKVPTGTHVPDLSMAPPSLNRPDGFGTAADSPVIFRSAPPPMYPPEMVMRGIEGWVRVRFTVTAMGTIADIQVLAARPDRGFVKAVVNAMQRWDVQPARRAGQPVQVILEREFNFSLDR